VGSKKTKSKQTYTPPSWVEGASKQAVGIGQRIGRKQYEAYTGDRVAGLSENERMGVEMARDNVGIAQPYYDKAETYADRGATSWTDADQSRFINPYIKGALDPAAREIREEGARGAMALDARASSMDAFGGSRAALMRTGEREKTLQGVEDLYGKGYADAYKFGAEIFGDERARDLLAANRFQQLGSEVQDSSRMDISTLMTTGATDRGVQQAMLDFDWQQFIEERDWDWKQLMGVVSALEGTKGSYSTTQTGESKTSGGNAAAVIGGIAQVVAAAYTGGASLALTQGVKAVADSGGGGDEAPDWFKEQSTPSDQRLKENIIYRFTLMGRKFYTWTWNSVAVALGEAGASFGVIAQENPDISAMGPDGFLLVDYSKLFGDQS